jgi:hypothetical protein
MRWALRHGANSTTCPLTSRSCNPGLSKNSAELTHSPAVGAADRHHRGTRGGSDADHKMAAVVAGDIPESCEFWSMRSRLTGQSFGAVGAATFTALGIRAIVGVHTHPGATESLVICAVGLALSIALFVNAFFTGRLNLARNRLTYRAILRTRSYSRRDLLRAETQVRFRAPSPRRFYMPVLIEQSGREYPLAELSTPLATDLYVLKSTVRVGSSEEDSQESLNGLAEWINSWIASADWIEDKDQSTVDG